jgi:hypothetical protein
MKEFKAEQGYGTENTRAKSCNTSGRAGAGLDAKGWRELGVNLLSTAALICGVAALFSPAGAAVGVAALVFGFAGAALKCFDASASDCRESLLIEAVAPVARWGGGKIVSVFRGSRRVTSITETTIDVGFLGVQANGLVSDWKQSVYSW